MATFTPNFNLKKPATSDLVNVADLNGNMDTLDTQLKLTNDSVTAIKPVRTIRRTTDLDRSSSTTLTDDPVLALSVVSGKAYVVRGMFIFQWAVTAAMGLKWDINWPGIGGIPLKVVFSSISLSSNTAVNEQGSWINNANPQIITTGNTSNAVRYLLDGIITPNANGNLTFRWAQNSSSTDPLSLLRNSFLQVTEVV